MLSLVNIRWWSYCALLVWGVWIIERCMDLWCLRICVVCDVSFGRRNTCCSLMSWNILLPSGMGSQAPDPGEGFECIGCKCATQIEFNFVLL